MNWFFLESNAFDISKKSLKKLFQNNSIEFLHFAKKKFLLVGVQNAQFNENFILTALKLGGQIFEKNQIKIFKSFVNSVGFGRQFKKDSIY
jgi:uncharacterized pyridoxamine 5'-phosphate oxidase family protein